MVDMDSAMAWPCPLLLGADAAESAGGVYKADHLLVELLRLLHQALGLPVALRVGGAKFRYRCSLVLWPFSMAITVTGWLLEGGDAPPRWPDRRRSSGRRGTPGKVPKRLWI